MAIRLGLNIDSLKAQRQLSNATARVATAFERLSSGLRINDASDDPAGLSVASGLNVKARVLTTAARNISDGISLTNILSSALSSQQEILTRMSELAEQSANGVYSTTQRKAMNKEYEALTAEFGRIAQTTTFNGVQLLQGPQTQITFQVGSDGGATSQISVSSANTSPYTGVVAGPGDYDGTGSVDIFDINAFIGADLHRSLDEVQKMGGGTLLHMTVTDSKGQSQNVYIMPFIYNYGGSGETNLAVWAENANGTFDVVASTSSQPPSQPFSIAASFSGGGTATLSVNLSQLTINPLTGAAGQQVSSIVGGVIGGSGLYSAKTAIDYTGVETQLRAQDALNVVANRSADLSLLQGQYGAVENRLGVALNVARTMSDANTAAASRILDADVAAESAELVRNQILQQAAASVLAHANQEPNIVLGLLRG